MHDAVFAGYLGLSAEYDQALVDDGGVTANTTAGLEPCDDDVCLSRHGNNAEAAATEAGDFSSGQFAHRKHVHRPHPAGLADRVEVCRPSAVSE